MLVTITVEEIMSAPARTVHEDATARDVARALEDHDVGSLVVVDDGTPSGIVTESDLVRLVATEATLDAVTVGEFMSTDLVTAAPDDTVEHAAGLLRDYEVRRLPVVDADELVGVVTTSDVSYYLPHMVHRSSQSPTAEPRFDIRPETTYEQEDWEFSARGVEEGGVTPGDVVEFTKTFSEEDVRSFAEASGDTNRLHLEDEYAGRTRFGERIVHGTLVAGLVSAALARLPGLTIYLSQDLTFHAPVGIGDRVTAVCEVVESLQNDRYVLSTAVYDDEGEQVIEGEAVVLIDPLPEETSVAVEPLS